MVRAEVLTMEKSSLGYNCVKFARTKADFPLGLWTYNDKLRLVRTYEPYVGAVFLQREKIPYGHIGIVKEVRQQHIIAEDANWIPGYITTRCVPKKEIIGYF